MKKQAKAARSDKDAALKPGTKGTTTIGGVTVKLRPIHGKGNLSVAFIKRIIREIKAERTTGKSKT